MTHYEYSCKLKKASEDFLMAVKEMFLARGRLEMAIYEATVHSVNLSCRPEDAATDGMSLESLDIGVRVLNALHHIPISSVGELAKMTAESLLKERNIGQEAIKEISIALERVGRHLAMK